MDFFIKLLLSALRISEEYFPFLSLEPAESQAQAGFLPALPCWVCSCLGPFPLASPGQEPHSERDWGGKGLPLFLVTSPPCTTAGISDSTCQAGSRSWDKISHFLNKIKFNPDHFCNPLNTSDMSAWCTEKTQNKKNQNKTTTKIKQQPKQNNNQNKTTTKTKQQPKQNWRCQCSLFNSLSLLCSPWTISSTDSHTSSILKF